MTEFNLLKKRSLEDPAGIDNYRFPVLSFVLINTTIQKDLHLFHDIIPDFPMFRWQSGVIIRIVAFQSVDLGSIPGHRTFLTRASSRWLKTRKRAGGTAKLAIPPRSPEFHEQLF